MALIPHFFNERPLNRLERELLLPKLLTRNLNHDVVARELYQNLLNPLRQVEDLYRQMEQVSSAINHFAVQGSNTSSDSEKFQVNVDVQHFAPDEISVKVNGGFVTVEGKHEEKQDEHGYISRQFVRRYALPQGCLPDTVQSKLSSDGVLTVIAPKILPMPSSGERIVPITQTGPVKKQIGSPDTEQTMIEELN